MAALSAVVFTLSGWLGLYLLARDPRKPVLALAAAGLCGFAVVVALDAVRSVDAPRLAALGGLEIYLAAVPSVAWFAVLVELSRPGDHWRARTGELLLVGGVGALTLVGAAMAGSVEGPLRPGHLLMMAVISMSTLGAMVVAVRRHAQPTPVAGVVVMATLFFALANAILIIPLGLVPSWLALASTGFDVLALGVAVALWDAFDEGQALRADMLRSFAGCSAVATLFGGQALIGLALTRHQPATQLVLTALLFTTLTIAITVQVLADPLAGLLDRLAFSKSPALRADRAALRHTGAALPLRSPDPLGDLRDVDDDTFARLTRRALGHYADLTKLVASPLTALPVIDDRLAARGAPDHPLERANELKAVLADGIARLKPRNAGDFGTTEEWRYYNSLYFPYVVGVRAYAQNATAAGLDPTARQAWQWLVTEVPQRSLHNWQNAAARLIAADLRGVSLTRPA
ncbi:MULTISPECIES: hypothetical protein [unclassified Mycobacterium]|uniref:hypothetical protein n=1 Tax=unclassified Mycobacterium TaxID=2642494 RepID=UPI0008002C57|nr:MULTISPECIES: hypothetical protein [unclassified Mycobacterium]OBH08225.1 hypothetical protein A5696_20040 [Mycobacterium sp. E2699]OBI56502.1 hypothetical protein A5705_21895 [Mycobacterium sp. E787]